MPASIKQRFATFIARFRRRDTEVLLERVLDLSHVSQLISRALCDGTPFLAGRVGWVECAGVGKSLQTGRCDAGVLARMQANAGIFPPTEKELEAFSLAYLDALGEVDLLGVMQCPYEAALVGRYGNEPKLADIAFLEPYFYSEPWSQHLEGLKVLVIHPFVESIRRQYGTARERLFVNPKVLPRFDLKLVRAPQTIAGNSDGFRSWSQALGWLKEQVSGHDFDAAIVGCGAYGLPIGAFIKRQGKVCIHLGGATQILFGITGARWRDRPHFEALQTEAWRPPLEEERPPGWKNVEDGCYW